MSTKTHKIIQLIVASATALVIIGVALNIVVMQTLGSFDAASVILGLYVGFWAFVLGNMALILSSIWLFMLPEPTSTTAAADEPEPIRLHTLGHNRMCA
jgi:hypothetical protein